MCATLTATIQGNSDGWLTTTTGDDSHNNSSHNNSSSHNIHNCPSACRMVKVSSEPDEDGRSNLNKNRRLETGLQKRVIRLRLFFMFE
jgi:hypothetical protein